MVGPGYTVLLQKIVMMNTGWSYKICITNTSRIVKTPISSEHYLQDRLAKENQVFQCSNDTFREYERNKMLNMLNRYRFEYTHKNMRQENTLTERKYSQLESQKQEDHEKYSKKPKVPHTNTKTAKRYNTTEAKEDSHDLILKSKQ